MQLNHYAKDSFPFLMDVMQKKTTITISQTKQKKMFTNLQMDALFWTPLLICAHSIYKPHYVISLLSK